MSIDLYRVRKGKVVSGVLAGIAHKLGWEAWLRSCPLYSRSSIWKIFYLVNRPLRKEEVYFLPYKEDKDAEKYGTGPRKIKDAEKIRKF